MVKEQKEFQISYLEGKEMYKKPFIIAEAGCNHMGQMEIAKDLILTAAYYCKADAIKFQKRCPKELLTLEQYHTPHPNPANSYGETYGAHREFLEFDVEQHAQLKKYHLLVIHTLRCCSGCVITMKAKFNSLLV